MKIVQVPGVNGLGETKGAEKASAKICEDISSEEIKLDIGDIEGQLEKIYSYVKNNIDGLFFVGGDHSISFPLVKSFFEKNGRESKLIIFDAHPDLMSPMKEPTHEEWLRGIVELGFDSSRIMLVGVRRNNENIDSSEIEYAEEGRIKIIYSDEFKTRKNEITEFASSGKVYLSLDIDALDSSVTSSTGYAESDGLSEEQFFEAIESILKSGNVISGDLVEINFEKGDSKSNGKALVIARKVLKSVRKE